MYAANGLARIERIPIDDTKLKKCVEVSIQSFTAKISFFGFGSTFAPPPLNKSNRFALTD
jgi:hypothetical protein